MKALPVALEKLIEALAQLPGVGPRSAERYAYFLLRADPAKAHLLASSLDSVHKKVSYCPITFALINSSEEISPLYSNSSRDKQIVAVVADPFDIVALEKLSAYNGTYHVLGGLLSPLDGIGPEQLHIPQLIERIKNDNVTEIIMATNASVEGESTALFLQQQFGDLDVKVTRLARGLPVGVDIEYADQITLGRALEGRQTI